MWVESIVCNISVVFLVHSVHTGKKRLVLYSIHYLECKHALNTQTELLID